MSKNITAVCIWIPGPNNTVLSITRRNKPTSWALIGGKVEPNENLINAIIRETKEEAGLTLDPRFIHYIYTRNNEGFECAGFYYNVPPEGQIQSEDKTMQVGFMPVNLILDEDTGAYYEYNRIMREHIQCRLES